jgi:hypothetical protein
MTVSLGHFNSSNEGGDVASVPSVPFNGTAVTIYRWDTTYSSKFNVSGLVSDFDSEAPQHGNPWSQSDQSGILNPQSFFYGQRGSSYSRFSKNDRDDFSDFIVLVSMSRPGLHPEEMAPPG